MRVLDAFCGAGGFSEGFRQAGHEIVAALDNDEKAIIAHGMNHPNTNHIMGDIRDKFDEIEKLGPYDIVIGSPPCQQFSVANTSENRDPSKGMELVDEFIQLVDRLKPRYWIGENVKASKDYIQEKHHFKTTLLLNAVDFGVPQKRIRYFFGRFKPPIVSHAKHPIMTLDNRELRKWVNVSDILDENEENWSDFDELSDIAKKRVIDYDYQQRSFNYCKLVNPNQPKGTIPAHKDVQYMLLVSNANSGSNGKMVQEIFEPGWTITTAREHFITNAIKFRRFSFLEIKRMMGFSDNYQFYGNKSDQIRQMGNAVCPPVARAIGEMLI